MKIDHYISELLYDHDCVIVTDLGGFIANYKPASINPALHVISPPSKKLAFNASLKNNDGLLANHIAHRTRLNYMDACDVIRDYVKDATSGMRDGQKLKIDKVGVLYFDQEDRLQFLPDHHANYLIDSFGLSPVHAPVIKRSETGVVVNKEPITRSLPAHEAKPKKEIRIFGWKVLEMVPAAAVLAILILTPPVLDEFNSNLSSLLPFSRLDEYLEDIKGEGEGKQQVTIPHINPFEIPPASVSQPLPEKLARSTETHQPENTSGESTPETLPTVKPETSPVPAATIKSKTVTASADTTSVATINRGEQTYYVIGGCFRSRDNAEKFVSDMKLKGMEATIIGQNNSGLYMVSLFSSASFNQTSDALPEIKSNAVESAWVYKK